MRSLPATEPTDSRASTRLVRRSASQDLEENSYYFFHQAKDAAESGEDVFLKDVPSDIGSLIIDSVEELGSGKVLRWSYNAAEKTITGVMPTFCHDSTQWWLEEEKMEMFLQGFLTAAEHKMLRTNVGTSDIGFGGQWAGSIKQGDVTWRPVDYTPGAAVVGGPTIVVEAGWSEGVRKLTSEVRMWLGGMGSVNLALMIKYYKVSNSGVTGYVEEWRTVGGVVQPISYFDIFPDPQYVQHIVISRSDLFGPAIMPGRNGTDTWSMDVARLRAAAAKACEKEGYVPR